MQFTKKQIKNILQGSSILIVEDNVDLAKRIANLLEPYCGVEPFLAHSVEKAEEVIESGSIKFSLAIVDVMLPKTEEKYMEIQEHVETLEQIRNEIHNSTTQSDYENSKVIEARAKRITVLDLINDLIEKRAGIELVKSWQPILEKQNRSFPVLYLTAVGDPASDHEGLVIAGEHSLWTVKPAIAQEILEKCAILIKTSKDK